MNLRQLTNEEKATILASLDVMMEIMGKKLEPISPELKLIKAAIAVVKPGTLMVLEMTAEENKQFANGEIKIEKMGDLSSFVSTFNSNN